MDTSGNGDLDATEFVEGCMRLKGPARSIDVSLLMQEHKRDLAAAALSDLNPQVQRLMGCLLMAPRALNRLELRKI